METDKAGEVSVHVGERTNRFIDKVDRHYPGSPS